MRSLIIRGGRPLAGEIPISGSKNAVLPMLAATVLFREPCLIRNVPDLTDVDAALEILTILGAKVCRRGTDLEIDPRSVSRWEIPRELMVRMRGSVFFAGPLLARFGRCRLTVPGGCPLGQRPVDFHAMGLKTLGAEEDGDIYSGSLTGGRIRLPYPSVGATENLILAALGASGTTTIQNAAREPEIVCLCGFLRSGGASVSGDGTDTLIVTGGLPDRGEHTVIPDRMEAATYLCACASAGGAIRLNGAEHSHLTAVLDALERAGCRLKRQTEFIEIKSGALYSPGIIETAPYPGFPTDAQAPFMAAMLRLRGEAIIRETVFDGRMAHVSGLRAMGGRIRREGNIALITGVNRLLGAEVTATDLRGGAALVCAALAAEGESIVRGMHHILRGYGHFTEKLRALGADIRPA